MTKYKVEVDERTCIGCGACTVACDNFAMKGKTAKAVKEIIDQSELKANKEAEEGCPVAAITVKKIDE
jgi:ferredoxin